MSGGPQSSPDPGPLPPTAADVCNPPIPDEIEALLAQLLVIAQPAGTPIEGRWSNSLGGILVTREADLSIAKATRGDGGLRPFLAVDEEGGRVTWLENPNSSAPAARKLATQRPAQIGVDAYRRGLLLKDAGIDVNFAPVLDLYPGTDGGVIGDRAYSRDPAQVAEFAGDFAAGMMAAGIVPTLKHFPGHGLARGDSHAERAVTEPLSVLAARDLVPYESVLLQLEGDVMIMTGHIEVPGLTSEGTPATLDEATYRYLRESLNFSGLIITDELSGMRAISARYDRGNAIIQALAAGADLALIADSSGLDDLISELSAAVQGGDLPEEMVREAAKRVINTKVCSWGLT